MTRRFLAVGLALVLGAAIGCSDDLAPATVDVTGMWNLSYADLTGTGGTFTECHSTTPSLFTLTQSGNSLSGNYQAGALLCTRASGPPSTVTLSFALIEDASVSGDHVSFSLPGVASLKLSGTATQSTMSGTCTGEIDGSPLSGNWSATRVVE
jgi:hypothetical protein